MSSITDEIAEQAEIAELNETLSWLKQSFETWLTHAKNDKQQQSFWIWFARNKEKIEYNRGLINTVGWKY